MFDRKKLLAGYHEMVNRGEPIVGGGAGTGLKDIIVLVHGGPVSSTSDAEYVLSNTQYCHGFYGASSMERLPTEIALTEQTREFKAIGRKSGGDAQ